MNHSILSVICLITGFLVCQYIPAAGRIREKLEGVDGDNTRLVVLRRILLYFFFGVLPISLIYSGGTDGSSFGLNFRLPVFTLLAGLLMGSVLMLMVWMNHRSEDNLRTAPQIRKKEWDTSLVLLSSVSWVLYLLAYEFFFRGYLLFSMLNDFGLWEAVTLNVAFYSLVHLPAGWKETIGAIPLGLLFCLISIHTGNFWSAFIAHTIMALSNEWFSLSAHPDMKHIR